MSVLHWMKLSCLPPIGAGLIKVWGKAMRIETSGGELIDTLYRQGHRIIIAFWHGQQLMMPLAYRGTVAYILISSHRDGELIYRVVRRFGLRAVRGSSTRGGSQALRQMIRLARQGCDLVVTPDGPKGPRGRVQEGIVYLAKMTGLPIVPLTFACTKKKSCPVGIGSLFRTQEGVDSFCGGNPSGWSGRLHLNGWRRCAWNWKPRWTA